jgi:PHP family Zn ribbon phosphoesterase
MSVNNIVHMARLKELDIIALTDHNTAKNCPAFLKVAQKAGILALSGMEINTAEEVHAVCLFTQLEQALAFDEYVAERLPPILNDPAIFGEQLILNEHDEVTGSVDKLLINASSISFFELEALMQRFGGVYFPAHIDKSTFSLLSNLGFVPQECVMDAYELADVSKKSGIIESNPLLADLPLLKNSDAHYLWDISEAENRLDEDFLALLRQKGLCEG